MALEDDLKQFTGTTRHYRHPLGLRYTDGIHYLAEQAGAYWLIDLVASYQPQLATTPFQLWTLTKHTDESATVTMQEDSNLRPRVRQEIPYTDFPLHRLNWYCINRVMLLQAEY